jgi:hypothetical protein
VLPRFVKQDKDLYSVYLSVLPSANPSSRSRQEGTCVCCKSHICVLQIAYMFLVWLRWYHMIVFIPIFVWYDTTTQLLNLDLECVTAATSQSCMCDRNWRILIAWTGQSLINVNFKFSWLLLNEAMNSWVTEWPEYHLNHQVLAWISEIDANGTFAFVEFSYLHFLLVYWDLLRLFSWCARVVWLWQDPIANQNTDGLDLSEFRHKWKKTFGPKNRLEPDF